MRFDHIIFRTGDGRIVTLKELEDHMLELKIEDQVIARFSQTRVTIENILKEVEAIGKKN